MKETVKIKTTGTINPIKTITLRGTTYYPSHVFHPKNTGFYGKHDRDSLITVAGISYYSLKN